MALSTKHRELPTPDRAEQPGPQQAVAGPSEPPWLPAFTRGRLVFLAAFGTISLAALTLFGLIAATQQPPRFYLQADIPRRGERVKVSRRFESRATALLSGVPTDAAGAPSHWSARFTEREINAWLAVAEAKAGRPLLGGQVRHPRVALGRHRLQVGYQLDVRGVTTIGSVDLGIALQSPNVVACRVHQARAGLLPLPLKGVLEAITRLARQFDCPIHWMQADGDPVAMISLPPARSSGEETITLERLTVTDGEIRLAGRSGTEGH